MTKRIVIIGPAHPLRGGLATFNQLLATKLQEQGHEVRLVTFSLQYPNFLFPGKTQYSTDPKPDNLDITAEINSVNPLNWIKVGRKLMKERPDLVIFRYWMPFMGPCLGTVARTLKKNGHTRVVAITDNVIPHETRFFDTPFTRYFLASCHGFVAMSKAVLADLRKFEADKPALYNPHPMYESFGPILERNEAISKLQLNGDFRYLLFFGFIRKYKGLDVLLKAFADERMRAFPVKLIIAGEYYTDPQPYKQMIDDLDLGDHVIQRNDFIPDSEVGVYFSAADMVVQTYLSATQSGVTQVAYFYQRPMLVTDVGGLAELVPDQRVGYVTPVDPKAVADALVDLYSNERLAEFEANVVTERERFTWNSLIEALFTSSK